MKYSMHIEPDGITIETKNIFLFISNKENEIELPKNEKPKKEETVVPVIKKPKPQRKRNPRRFQNKSCQNCHHAFEPTGPTQRFCSEKCKAQFKKNGKSLPKSNGIFVQEGNLVTGNKND